MTLLVVVFVSCSKSQRDDSSDISAFPKAKRGVDYFFRIGSIEKIVIPETSDNSLIAAVDKIAFSGDGDFYIGDYFSQKTIFRFNGQGKFLAKIGKLGQGPGEYNNLTGFSVDSQGRVFILSDSKIIIYDRKGKLIREARIEFLGGDLECLGDAVFARIHLSRGAEKKGDNLFNVYNDRLEEKRALFRNDGRLKKYMFLPHTSMAIWRGGLFFTDVYDLALNMYDPNTGQNTRWAFLDEDSRFASSWKKPVLDEDDRSIIKKNIRRFDAIYASESRLYLIELKKNKNEVNLWIIDPSKKTILVFPFLELIGSSERKSSSIRFDYPAGAYQNGLVFVIDDEQKLKAIQNKYPQFRDAIYGSNQNPALIFFRFN